MTTYTKNGNKFMVADDESLQIFSKLPGGNYIVQFSQMIGFYLEHVDPFPLPNRLYGSLPRYADRILQTYQDRPASTGVMLNGEKGSGKTLLAKLLSLKMMEADCPTLIINSSFVGDAFNKFIQDIDQCAMILFDEFEKVYDKEHQPHILTLMDGVFPTKKLFVLTCNDNFKIDSHMKNRPGRLFYMLDFDGLEEAFIREFCAENLKPTLQKYVEQVMMLSGTVDAFNFDMLKALCEEMNRYDENANEAVKMLNVKPDPYTRNVYKVLLYLQKSGHWVEVPTLDVVTYEVNLDLSTNFAVHIQYNIPTGRKKKDGTQGKEQTLCLVQARHFKEHDALNRAVVYEVPAANGQPAHRVLFQRPGKKKSGASIFAPKVIASEFDDDSVA